MEKSKCGPKQSSEQTTEKAVWRKTLKHSGSSSRKLFRSEWESHENVDFCVFGATSKAQQSEKRSGKISLCRTSVAGDWKITLFLYVEYLRKVELLLCCCCGGGKVKMMLKPQTREKSSNNLSITKKRESKKRRKL